MLKSMARRGLIAAGRVEGGWATACCPSWSAFTRMQVGHAWIRRWRGSSKITTTGIRADAGSVQPAVHRVIPVGESVQRGYEIQPYESAADICEAPRPGACWTASAASRRRWSASLASIRWTCAWRFSQQPGAFDQSPVVRALTGTKRWRRCAAQPRPGWCTRSATASKACEYMCNCCTCSCGVLRGIAELGIANAVARSAFVNTVDEDLCNACAELPGSLPVRGALHWRW